MPEGALTAFTAFDAYRIFAAQLMSKIRSRREYLTPSDHITSARSTVCNVPTNLIRLASFVTRYINDSSVVVHSFVAILYIASGRL